ncbi:hypothetical protein PG993_001009 [Apiospora rasikravindrae]|uniref:Shugoshin C-terminal domain-containing protein n=1 Tax=Apiospora rasikravindrae TaxID=990691 RepID=A0ABR1UA58_9PEZI
MPGGKTKHVLGPDGVFSSQNKATGNSSRASSALSDEDEVIGYAEDDPASQKPKWRPEAISSPRSSSSRSNANRTRDQHPTEQVIREEDFSDDAGPLITPGKTPGVPRQSRGRDQSSVNASESDVHENLVGSEELEFSDDVDDTKSEETAKSFGEEEYVPSQRLNGTRPQSSQSSQKALRGSTRGAKQDPVKVVSVRSSKDRDNSSHEREDTEEPDIVQVASAGKTESDRRNPQHTTSQKPARIASSQHSDDEIPTTQLKLQEEQGARVLPFKRRVAKKPFTPGNKEDDTKASLSKLNTTIPASTGFKTGVKGRNVAEAQTHRVTQKGSISVNPKDPFEIEGSPEPDTKRRPSAGRSRKTTKPKANSQGVRKLPQSQHAVPRAANPPKGKPTVKGSRDNLFDDIEDDDDAPLSLNASVTKPNSKKRRSSPQDYGSRPKKPKGPEANFHLKDGGSISVQPSSKERTDPKKILLGPKCGHYRTFIRSI